MCIRDRYRRKPLGYVPTKTQFDTWNNTPESPNDFKLNNPNENNLTAYTKCVPLPPNKNIKDIEIYDKRIDWDNENSDIRFISESSPPNHKELFKIKWFDGVKSGRGGIEGDAC